METEDGPPGGVTRYDGDWWVQVGQRPYDSDGPKELPTEIVYAVAAIRGIDPTKVTAPTLYDCADVSAIESVCFGQNRSSRGPLESVRFRFGEFLVMVTSNGWIQIYEPNESQRERLAN
ncbi:hypothetical protein OB920_15095 [Halobacteria archaeon HArc-gm2]|nr:hypothetical protein [Halobacteria archaeon HArc-gm2]